MFQSRCRGCSVLTSGTVSSNTLLHLPTHCLPVPSSLAARHGVKKMGSAFGETWIPFQLCPQLVLYLEWVTARNTRLSKYDPALFTYQATLTAHPFSAPRLSYLLAESAPSLPGQVLRTMTTGAWHVRCCWPKGWLIKEQPLLLKPHQVLKAMLRPPPPLILKQPLR